MLLELSSAVADPAMTAYTLIIHGAPVGWQRTRTNHAQRRHFNDPKTEAAEAVVVIAWIEAGSPRFDEGPLTLSLVAVMERPAGHFKRDGTLSASGLRSSYPTKKPDADNLVKLVCDALNTRGYRDDAQIVSMDVRKRWALPGEPPHTRVTVALKGSE